MRIKNILMLCLLPLLAACAHDVSVGTSSRVYENVTADQVTSALPTIYTHAGYLIKDAKLEKTTESVIVNGQKTDTQLYRYSGATLPDGDCVKLSSTKVLVMPQLAGKKPLQLVTLQVLDATCYNAIKKVTFAIETDPKFYQRFFALLDESLGQRGIIPGTGGL